MKNHEEARISEDKIQSDFHTWLWNTYPKTRRLAFHIPNGGYRTAREGNKFKAMGVVAGTPDYMICIPARGYHGLFIEFKAPGGKVSHDQNVSHAQLQHAGYGVIICYSTEEAKQHTEWYLKETDYVND